jgi:hypothetical protein
MHVYLSINNKVFIWVYTFVLGVDKSPASPDTDSSKLSNVFVHAPTNLVWGELAQLQPKHSPFLNMIKYFVAG